MPVPKRKGSRETVVRTAAIVAILALAPGAWSTDLATDPVDLALVLLHDGRFDAAAATLDRADPGADDPRIAFFRAFVVYWRLLYDEDNESLRRTFESALRESLRLAESEASGGEPDPEMALWSGNARLLRAELRAAEKHPFSAGFEAKKAKRLLEAAERSGDHRIGVEPLFGLGTYNYVADRLPAFVKGLKALLFLPGGDRDRGLAQLDRAATESRYFSLEARILLATIYANKHERMYEIARRQAELALRAAPEAIAAHHASAVIEMSLADPEKAIVRLDAALDRARSLGDVHPSVVAALELLRARADFANLRPDLARERASRLLARKKPGVPDSILREADGLLNASEQILARPGWRFASAVLSAPADGSVSLGSRLAGLAEREDGGHDGVLALLAGRALLDERHETEALRWLTIADASGALPEPWVGPCRLFAGQAADLSGRRPQALDFYKRAEKSPPFDGRNAARLFQSAPYRAGS